MSRGSHEQWYPATNPSVSSLTVALFTVAAIMFVTGLATALGPVPRLVTAAYYVSTFMLVVLLWAHGLRTAHQQ